MGKRELRKWMKGLIITAFVLFLLVPAEKAFAEFAPYGKVTYAKKITLINGGYKDSPNRPYLLEMGSKIENAKKVTADLDNMGVVYGDATLNSYTGKYQIQLYAHGKGTAKLKVKVKGSGGVKTYKATIKVVDYQNPVKVFKIGSRNYASKFKKYKWQRNVKFPSTNSKLVVKPAKNWKIKLVEVSGNTKDGYIEIKDKKVKANVLSQFITLNTVFVTLANTKTKAVERVELYSY